MSTITEEESGALWPRLERRRKLTVRSYHRPASSCPRQFDQVAFPRTKNQGQPLQICIAWIFRFCSVICIIMMRIWNHHILFVCLRLSCDWKIKGFKFKRYFETTGLFPGMVESALCKITHIITGKSTCLKCQP